MSIHEVKRTALVTFTPEQMFDLVVDVERYCEFLPWVKGAEVHERTERELEASITMERAGVKQGFTTRNVMDRPSSMSLTLVEGPFRMLGTLLEANPFLGRIITGRIASVTVKPNQQIKVLSRDGKVVETGSFNELVALGGVFAQLARAQFMVSEQPAEAPTEPQLLGVRET